MSTAEAERNVRKAPLSAGIFPSSVDSLSEDILDNRTIDIKRPVFPHIISPYYLTSSVSVLSLTFHSALSYVVMSHSPAPPARQPSAPELKLYSSQPTLDVPAVGEAGRPPPVKFMCVFGDMSLPYPAEVLMLEKVNTRISKPVTTPQARSFLDATSKGAVPS
jgi:hypothetical protein